MITDPKILVCYNEPTRYFENYVGKECQNSDEDIDLSESEFAHHIELIVDALKVNYNFVDTLPIGNDIDKIINDLTTKCPDIIFNFVESIDGNSSYESHVAGLFDILGYPYTGNSPLSLGNCLHKSRTKQILQGYGIPTPKYCLLPYSKKISINDFNLSFPVIAKLQHEDASIGISEYSVISDKKALSNRLKFLFNNYKQDVLVEEYIEGRELNVSILGDRTLPISEISFEGLPDKYPRIITYEAKWSPDSIYYKNTNPQCPATLNDDILKRINETAIEAYNALGCRDYARIDIRLSNKNIPYVIEVNPNPDISVDSGFIRSSSAANIDYNELLKIIAKFAIDRIEDDTQVSE